ncbi:MAG: hypothetical protein IPK55_13065 [Streptococcus sp.]|nr:hypothetical protein [Streptococcus sp.]
MNPLFQNATQHTLLDTLYETAELSKEYGCYSHSDGLQLLIMILYMPLLLVTNIITYILGKPFVFLASIGSLRQNQNSGFIVHFIGGMANLLAFIFILVPTYLFFIASPLLQLFFFWHSSSFYKFPQGALFTSVFNAIYSFFFLLNFSDVYTQVRFQHNYNPFDIVFSFALLFRPFGRGAIL